jgi:heptosyltransferase-1
MINNTDNRTLNALLRSATCIVGGDTGPLHLAIALGAPAVAIFGPTDPARNGPYRNPHRFQSDAPAVPVGQDTDPCDGDIVLRAPNSVTSHVRNNQTDSSMLAITVEAVLKALLRRIGATT